MRIAVLLVCAACSSKQPDYPVGGGGGGGSGADGGATVDSKGSGSDAGSGGQEIDAAKVNGRVCLLADPHKMTTCASSGAGGLTVRLAAKDTVTSDDGRFTIDAPSSSATTWRVTGSTIVTSIMLYSDYQIPAVTTQTFDAMKTSNGTRQVAILPGQGSIIASLVQNGGGLVGATVFTTPMNSTYHPFYDSATAGAWNQTATGAGGIAWIPGLDVGMAPDIVHADDGNGTTLATASQPVVDGAITWVNVVFP